MKKSKPKVNTKHTRIAVKRRIVDLLGGKCQLCGYSKCLGALEFHHVDPSTKKFNLSHVIRKHYPWSLIEKELEKVIVLCCNCHREYHLGEVLIPDTLARYRRKK